MRKILCFVLLSVSLFLARAVAAQDVAKADAAAAGALSGRWVVNADFFGSPIYFGLLLEQQGEKLTGNFDGDKLEGSSADGRIHFLAKDEHGGTEEGNATISGGNMTGSVIFADSSDPTHPETHSFTATRVAERREGAAKRHEFVPTTFYRRFSAENKPVLTIAPGDTIHTATVDAGGTDEKGVTRVLGGNPETGPFYIETAAPGDTLAVHIIRLRLNRDWAESDDGIVGRALDADFAVKMKDGFKNVRWRLDRQRGVAMP